MEQDYEHEPEANPSVKGHIAQAKRRYRKARDDEQELQELIEARNVRDQQDSTQDPDNDDTTGLDAEEATFKKRYGDLRRHAQKQQEEHRKELARMQEQIDTVSKKEMRMPKSEDELEEWSNKYPDVAQMVETIALKKSRETAQDIEKEMAQLKDMRRNINRQKAEQELKELHPDFDKIRKDPEFHEWASVQPKWVQSALYDNEDDAVSCSKALTLYKAEVKTRKKQSSARADAAESVNPRGRSQADERAGQRGKYSESMVKKMSQREYERVSDDIEESIRAGTFVFDITGAAR
tara:strand:- start:1965 stop:2846 length:882 start_codon:yes stop_codon:yes gene_type:complete